MQGCCVVLLICPSSTPIIQVLDKYGNFFANIPSMAISLQLGHPKISSSLFLY
jgi:hypothetical protein